MSKITNGQIMLGFGVLMGVLVGEPLMADIGANKLSNAPEDIQRLMYLTCASMFLTMLYVARRVD